MLCSCDGGIEFRADHRDQFATPQRPDVMAIQGAVVESNLTYLAFRTIEDIKHHGYAVTVRQRLDSTAQEHHARTVARSGAYQAIADDLQVTRWGHIFSGARGAAREGRRNDDRQTQAGPAILPTSRLRESRPARRSDARRIAAAESHNSNMSNQAVASATVISIGGNATRRNSMNPIG